MSRTAPRISRGMSFVTYLYKQKVAKQNDEGLVDMNSDENFFNLILGIFQQRETNN
jgi:hypothetical protein